MATTTTFGPRCVQEEEAAASKSAGGAGDGVRTPLDDYARWFREQSPAGDGGGSGQQAQADAGPKPSEPPRPRQQPNPQKASADEIEDMLAALKRKVNKE